VAYTLANAIDVLDAVDVPEDLMPQVVGRFAFFCNAGIRFIEEMCKMRAFVRLWDRVTAERYGVEDPKLRRFRCGVQVNSLGLTEVQPENNVTRIVLESLGVLLSRSARTRALQLPAWNEALGLPRPWDQQWSLRIQQILAHETDLLDYPDLFEGSHVVEARTEEICVAAWARVEEILAEGGAYAALDSGRLKAELVQASTARLARILSGEQVVVGRNRYQETEPSPLVADLEGAVVAPDVAAEPQQIARLKDLRARRDRTAVDAALAALARAAREEQSIMAWGALPVASSRKRIETNCARRLTG
jgi:(2R)-ethylmalonyl-CoA mutase